MGAEQPTISARMRLPYSWCGISGEWSKRGPAILFLSVLGKEQSHEEAVLKWDVTPPLYAAVMWSAWFALELPPATNAWLKGLRSVEGVFSWGLYLT
jgi:hypothetical protein